MPGAGLVLAIDIGGSGLKAGLVDGRGTVLATAGVAVAEASPAPGWAQQDADAWWQGLVMLMPDLLAGRGGRLAAIAVTGATRSQVVTDATGRPLLPAIMFRDRRAAEHGDPFHPHARLLWLQRERPAEMGRAAHVLQPKDQLGLRLTGHALSDPVSSYLTAGPPPAGAPAHLLPANAAIGTRLGPLLPEAAALLGLPAGLPVVLTGMDTWCATLAIGAVRVGAAYVSSGSSEVLGLMTDRPLVALGLVCPPWGDGLWHLGGPSQTGSASLEWLAGLTGRAVPNLLAAIPETAPDPRQAPLALPFLAGERVPLWRPDLRARLIGIDGQHGPAELARAFVEGIAFLDLLILERAEAAAGFRAPQLALTGGIAAAPAWARIKADILEREIHLFAAQEGALLGAAMTAMVSLGHFADLDCAQSTLARPRAIIAPDPHRAASCRVLAARWRAALDQLLDESPP